MIRRIALLGCLAAVTPVLVPPVSSMAEQLFSVHMAQHLFLIVIAAPLLVVSRVFDPGRTAILKAATGPVTSWTLFVSVFLFWHWPTAFQWAARRELGRLLEHATIFASAFLFWNVALSSRPQAWLSYGARALYVMTAAVATDLPGVIMVFSPQAICTMPHENAGAWGLTALQDQQVAGLLMWVPANLAFFSVATWLFARWISDPGETQQATPPQLVTQ